MKPKTVFFSSDRPGDLGQVKVTEILRFSNDDGLLFNHIWGRTVRDGDRNLFGIRRSPHFAICAIRAIEQYLDIARLLSIDLLVVICFDRLLYKVEYKTPFMSLAAEARLKLCLKEMHTD